MRTQAAREFAPIVSDEQRLDVSIVEGRTIIKLSTWVDGLGWSCQKTLDLEPALVEDLHRSLAAVRCRSSRVETSGDGKIVRFPVIS